MEHVVQINLESAWYFGPCLLAFARVFRVLNYSISIIAINLEGISSLASLKFWNFCLVLLR